MASGSEMKIARSHRNMFVRTFRRMILELVTRPFKRKRKDFEVIEPRGIRSQRNDENSTRLLPM